MLDFLKEIYEPKIVKNVLVTQGIKEATTIALKPVIGGTLSGLTGGLMGGLYINKKVLIPAANKISEEVMVNIFGQSREKAQ
jgi:uncharacterized protein YpuA (DUF1002 family)